MEKKTYKGGVGLRREIRILAILLSASVFFAACAGKEEPENPHARQAIEFVVGQEYTVKSTDTSFETGDRISLFAGDPVNADNVCLTCSGGKLVSETTLYWGEGQTSATDFTAIYPYSEDYLFAEGFSFTVEADQSSRSAHCASDLMVATTSAKPSAGPVALNFSHVLSRLAVQIDNRTGKKVSSVILSGVKLGYEYPDALASGIEGSICAYPASEDRWEFILPPQSAKPYLLIITSDGQQYTFNMASSGVFVAGRNQSASVKIGDGLSPVDNTRGWFEMPFVNDANRNGVDDGDSSLYYAYHSFSMNGRQMRNYTVCFSADHHGPMWVSAPRHSCYETKNTDRSDAYKADPDIPKQHQYSSKDTGGGCNKGHLLGSAERLCCAEANQQVFYYSNISPQFSTGFNTGGGGWNILEDWVDGQVCRDTLYEVVGCHYEKFTDGYGHSGTPATISYGGRDDVDRPTMFYYVLLRTKSGSSGKAVSECSAGELKCAAFVRAHNNSLKGQAVSSKEMMSVADLEKITGFTYFPNVPNAPKDKFSPSDWGL